MATAVASIIGVWKRTQELAKTGTSGQDTEEEWNNKSNSAQKALQQLLIDVAEINEKASDALNWLKISSGVLSSDSTGKVTFPDNYLHMDSVTYVSGGQRYPSVKLATNEIDMTRTSPIRKPDLTTNDINWYLKGGALYVMPEQASIVVDLMYYRVVPDASIVLTPVSDDDSDLVTPSVGVAYGWPVSVFNLLVYLILEQLGVELKENMLVEFADFGINREMIKTTPQ